MTSINISQELREDGLQKLTRYKGSWGIWNSSWSNSHK